ncbi:hypothetical protein Tco_1122933 [Tanacetum coccineum]|uniref:Uncharacterized protein n=1 Tax=Tanacetum coccineum TaxID=301880 RepID=A0ABQ5J1Y3_9ASTR
MKEQAYNKEQREIPRPHELNEESNLIDLMKEYVIGTIVSISDAIPFNYVGVDKIRRTVILEDYVGARLECCFFYSWSDKFSKLYDERDKSGIAVMILQLCKKPSVTPAMYSTKLYINNEYLKLLLPGRGIQRKKHLILKIIPLFNLLQLRKKLS